MPAGKYYCDYCDKYLQDTPSSRKRHLLALSHQRARSLWYQSFYLRPHRKMMMLFTTSYLLLLPSLSHSSSAFFHWFHFSASSLIILFNFSSFSLPKGFVNMVTPVNIFIPLLLNPSQVCQKLALKFPWKTFHRHSDHQKMEDTRPSPSLSRDSSYLLLFV